ncbi:MAG TPA: FecR family protein [Planctomicrobium sp.]|nr:FecR family protein [Planctomicrobium sp.]
MSSRSEREELHALLEALVNDSITREQHARLQSLLRDNPTLQDIYFSYIDVHTGLTTLHELPTPEESLIPPPRSLQSPRPGTRSKGWLAAIVVVVMLGGIFWTFFDQNEQEHVARGPELEQIPEIPVSSAPSPLPATPPDSSVRLTQAANAELFGALLPSLHSPLQSDHRYVLYQGMLELTFPNGATVVLEAPAIFEIKTPNRMELQIGHCSVHAPPGAEGFQILTPQGEVTDLGTRFSVKIDEGGHSDLHVIEGAARFQPKGQPDAGVTLFHGDAGRVDESLKLEKLDFNPQTYQKGLPDRVISYEAEKAGDGPEVRSLQSVTVQRGGTVRTYGVSELIGIDVISFVAGRVRNNLAWEKAPPDNPADLLSESTALNEGLFNFGGRKSLTDENNGSDGHPRRGMGIRFHKPVINAPGPDVVLFEVQSVVYPPEGDHFWVSPLIPQAGLRSHHVTRFDITMTSAEAKPVVTFMLTSFVDPPKSLDALSTAPTLSPRPQRLPFHALAVGIDLSDLGYPPNAEVEGLFFESDDSGSHQIDPVFIGGLP